MEQQAQNVPPVRERQKRTPVPARSSEERDRRELRMRDLVRESGLTRETIHFYLGQGLLPPPVASGRNTALYGPEHLERLQRIRELQEQQFLPLRAIKAIFDESADVGFTPEQDALIGRVRVALRGRADPAAQSAVPLSHYVPGRVSRAELRKLVATGLVAVSGAGANATVSAEDGELLACWSELKQVGIGPEQGFSPEQVSLYDRAMQQLVRQEIDVFSRHFAEASGETAVDVIERSLPVINRLLGVLHRKQVHRFVTEPATAPDA